MGALKKLFNKYRTPKQPKVVLPWDPKGDGMRSEVLEPPKSITLDDLLRYHLAQSNHALLTPTGGTRLGPRLREDTERRVELDSDDWLSRVNISQLEQPVWFGEGWQDAVVRTDPDGRLHVVKYVADTWLGWDKDTKLLSYAMHMDPVDRMRFEMHRRLGEVPRREPDTWCVELWQAVAGDVDRFMNKPEGYDEGRDAQRYCVVHRLNRRSIAETRADFTEWSRYHVCLDMTFATAERHIPSLKQTLLNSWKGFCPFTNPRPVLYERSFPLLAVGVRRMMPYRETPRFLEGR